MESRWYDQYKKRHVRGKGEKSDRSVVSLTKSLALREGSEKIRVNALGSGRTDTPMKTAFTTLDGDPEAAEKVVSSALGSIPLRRIADTS